MEPKTAPELTSVTPAELAALLGLPAEDAPYLSSAPVYLSASWVGEWQARTGPRELTIADVVLLTGLNKVLLYRAIKPDAVPRLRCRCLGVGRNPNPRISPANLVNFLRAGSAVHGITPAATETPTQRSRRGAQSREAALRACAGE